MSVKANKSAANVDQTTVGSFGREWERFDQEALPPEEHRRLFNDYFHIFPWDDLPEQATGFDMGCGSGRWAQLVAPRVGHLHCIDPSAVALNVARRKLSELTNVSFHNATSASVELPPGSQDFGYSLGVLHHIPDTEAALADCVVRLKPGAPFLLYLYYNFDNRPCWYKGLWKMSETIRAVVSPLPEGVKSALCDLIAITVYWPLARLCLVGTAMRLDMANFPLHSYRNCSFYTMRTDSRDRFGTPLEQRFSKAQVAAMMRRAGLVDVRFSSKAPFWCAVGKKQ